MEKTEKKHHRGRWFLVADAALTVIILAIGYILLRHSPRDYAPLPIDANLISSGEVSPYLTNHVLSSFYNGTQRGEPFSMTLDQAGINDIIAHCGWPQEFNGIVFATPFAILHNGRVDLMGRVTYNGVDTVVTVVFEPVFDPNGRFTVGVSSVKTGAIPITIVAKQMAKRAYHEQFGDTAAGPNDLLGQIIASALTDERFDPVFDAGHQRKFRMDSLKIEQGRATVHFAPLSK